MSAATSSLLRRLGFVAAGVAAVAASLGGPAVVAGAAPAPTVAVSPDSGLTDGQVVTVRAAGLPADRTIQVEQCQGTAAAPPPDNTGCDGLTLDTQATTDDQGNYVNAARGSDGTTGYRVYARPSPRLRSPTTITCDATRDCVLYVGVDQNDFSAPHVFADIRFAPGVVVAAPVPERPAAPVPERPAGPSTAATAATAAAGARPRAGSPPPAALPFTGPPPVAPLAVAGALLVASASLARRRALRPAPLPVRLRRRP